ncbi:MAG TPA: phosphoenolpyruvate--protein phosphotransferase [Sphingomonas sp.]|jgi:phosphoenolpyruvate-protein phosphotransferase|uniref:phosphoenolpyruvate--protein phosphotransferase n=1 Tax=Sphingomonas sp. TaxID=28214 RepID=UPI002EDB879B
MEAFTVMAPLAGWVTALTDVPDAVFAQRLLGDGLAIDPTGDTLHAPCDATIVSIHAGRHAIALRTGIGAELLIHLGIDTVALGGAGITPLVAAGASVRSGNPLLRFDLDALVQQARAVVTPIIMTDPERFVVTPIAQGLVQPGDPLFRIMVIEGTQRDAPAAEGALMRRTARVALDHGIHARPAARLAAAVRGLSAQVTLIHGQRRAAASSPIAMLSLGAAHGTELMIEAQGADAAAALDAVARILADDRPEAPAAVRTPTVAVAEGPGLRGVAAAPGLAVGRAVWLRSQEIVVPETGASVAAETMLLNDALTRVGADMTAAAAGIGGDVIAAQQALLDDPALIDAARAQIADGRSAAFAYRSVLRAQAATLAETGDARIAERGEDLRDLEGRVLRALLGEEAAGLAFAPGTILLAHELLPSQVAALDPAVVAGIALVAGGPTSHASILAAGLGVPMAVAFGPALTTVAEGANLVLDADRGMLDVDPPMERMAAATTRIAARQATEAAARAQGDAPCHTADGTRIEIFANLGSIADARAAADEGAEGCGLLRTEFLFLERTEPPSTEQQAADYQGIADALGDKPLIVRLLDVGGDKPAPYLAIAPEENPALGLRGIRVALARPDILDAQLRAILAVKPAGQCRIMVPMVASVAELDAVIAAVERLRDELGIATPVAVGVMVETPAAAMTADLLAERAAFLSIGTNDLTQYTLAMDRGNAAVAAGVDGLHPAVLRLIAATCDGARRHGTPVGVCGGLAADPLAVPILIGLGVDELSVPPARIVATKAQVATLSQRACAAFARTMLACETAAAVRTAAAAFVQGELA